ncbi:MAG: hypothetical protein IH984_16240 [Planctomycetes bacterium]|nr:hypothetical protein [Planctomycetota bacterium]
MSNPTTTSDPILPEVKMNLAPPSAPITGRVVSNDMCLKGKSNSYVRHTEIDITGTAIAGNFIVGQSFGVIAPGVDEKGKPHKVRLYSIACPKWGEDGQGNVISTTPKRVLEEYKPQKKTDDQIRHTLFIGVCSNFLCDLNPGDEVQITGPAGRRFLLPANTADHDYIFLATGTGIAPFRGMVKELLENPEGPCKSQIHLVMGAPYDTDLLYDELFADFATKHDNFHYHTAISREIRPDGSRGIYTHHCIDEKIETFRPLLENERTLIYICGIQGMQTGLYQVLATNGLSDAYLTIADDWADLNPKDWPWAEIKRNVRPTPRCMVEVY